MRKLADSLFASGARFVPVPRTSKGHPAVPTQAHVALAAATPEAARAALMAAVSGLRRVDVAVYPLGTYTVTGKWSVGRAFDIPAGDGVSARLHMDADARPRSVAVEAPKGADIDWARIYAGIRAVSGFSVCCEPPAKNPLPAHAEHEGHVREECLLVINHDE